MFSAGRRESSIGCPPGFHALLGGDGTTEYFRRRSDAKAIERIYGHDYFSYTITAKIRKHVRPHHAQSQGQFKRGKSRDGVGLVPEIPFRFCNPSGDEAVPTPS